MTESQLVYLDCPNCGDPIRTPFARGGAPTVYVHHRSNRASCRLVIQVAMAGTGHRVNVVPDKVKLEAALSAALAIWSNHTKGSPA